MPASAEVQAEALGRAAQGQSLINYPEIFRGMMAKGIPEADIRPRENVFTFNAWRALGRTVRKGEPGEPSPVRPARPGPPSPGAPCARGSRGSRS